MNQHHALPSIRRKVVVLSVVGFLAAALFAASEYSASGASKSSNTNSAQPAPGQTTTRPIAATVRARYSFRSDAAYVAKVASDPTATTDVLGIPLLPAERKEIVRRNALGANIGAISAALTPLGIYGGAWIDNGDGGKLKVAVTKTSTPTLEATVSSILHGQAFQFVHTNITEQELIAISLRVAKSPEWKTKMVQSSGVHPQTGTVSVVIATEAPKDSESTLGALFGPALSITRSPNKNVAASGYRDFHGGPLIGGGQLSFGADNQCTDGYSNVRDSIGRYYTITAGHCFTNGQYVYQGSGSSNPIGQASSSTVYDGASTYCDCEVIGQIPPGTGSQNVYVNGNGQFTFTQAADSFLGDTVCQSGARSYEMYGQNQCGFVTDDHHTTEIGYAGGSYQLVEGVEAQWTVLNGDSGAPVGEGPSIKGFISYTNGVALGGYSRASNVGASNVYLGF